MLQLWTETFVCIVFESCPKCCWRKHEEIELNNKCCYTVLLNWIVVSCTHTECMNKLKMFSMKTIHLSYNRVSGACVVICMRFFFLPFAALFHCSNRKWSSRHVRLPRLLFYTAYTMPIILIFVLLFSVLLLIYSFTLIDLAKVLFL